MKPEKEKVLWLYCKTCNCKQPHARKGSEWVCRCGEIGHDKIVNAQLAIQQKGNSIFNRSR